jgi:hypothetical protein
MIDGMNNATAVMEPYEGRIVTCVADPAVARALPCGTMVGDNFGGRSFNDNIAAILESRSNDGWREIDFGERRWTVIEIAK